MPSKPSSVPSAQAFPRLFRRGPRGRPRHDERAGRRRRGRIFSRPMSADAAPARRAAHRDCRRSRPTRRGPDCLSAKHPHSAAFVRPCRLPKQEQDARTLLQQPDPTKIQCGRAAAVTVSIWRASSSASSSRRRVRPCLRSAGRSGEVAEPEHRHETSPTPQRRYASSVNSIPFRFHRASSSPPKVSGR